MTYQLCDISHLSHVVQCVFCGFVQHDEAGGHNAQVPQWLRVRLHVTISICQRVIGGGLSIAVTLRSNVVQIKTAQTRFNPTYQAGCGLTAGFGSSCTAEKGPPLGLGCCF